MSILPIITIPNSVLKRKAREVQSVNDDVRKQIDNMLETMYDAQGIGLAANQVAHLQRILVMDVSSSEEKKSPIKMVNPKLVWESDEMSEMDEGCLSIPTQTALVQRPASVVVSYLGYDGKEAELKANGLLSHCVQHEMDHLDGVLCIDYLSSLKRNIVVRKVARAQRDAKVL